MAAPTSEHLSADNPVKKCLCGNRWELLQVFPASDTVVAKTTQRQATTHTEFNREETTKLNAMTYMKIATLLERERIGCKSRVFSIKKARQ